MANIRTDYKSNDYSNQRGHIVSFGLLLFIITVGFILRIYNIDQYPLWFDELASNRFSAELVNLITNLHGHDSVIDHFSYYCSSDPSSIFYYLIVFIYSLFFEGGQSLRFISVIFSAFSLVAFYLFARLFLNKRGSLYALLMMAISPFYLWYAQEARVYSMACFFAILTLYFFVRAIRKSKPIFWFFFTLFAIFALYASYYFSILLIVTGIVVLHKEYRRCFKLWMVSVAVIVISFLPSVFLIRSNLCIVKNQFWLYLPNLKTVFTTFSVFNFGYSAYKWQYYLGTTFFLGLLIYGTYSCCRKSKNDAAVLPILFFIPLALIYALSFLFMPIYIDRQLIIFSPLYYLLIVQGLSNIKRRSSQVILAVIVLFLIISSAINYYRGFMLSNSYGNDFYVGVHYKKDYRGLMEYIENNLNPDDFIMATDAQSLVIATNYFSPYISNKKIIGIGQLFYPYILNSFDSISAELGLNEWEVIKASKALYIRWFKSEKEYLQKISPDYLSSKRIWLISSTWERKNYRNHNYFKVKECLLTSHRQDLSMSKDGIFLELYNLE